MSLDFIHNNPHTGLEKTQGLKKNSWFLGFLFYFFFFWGGGFIGFYNFYCCFLYSCVFELFLTRRKKITVQQMFHLEV